MTPEEVRRQSENAYAQWAVQWREHCKIHSAYPQKPLTDFIGTGVGKAILCVANGNSFEENIDVIKANKDKCDIICCDKTLGHLIDNGIFPQFCVVCDANVDYEKYLKPYEKQLQNTILFNNACGNPKWTANGNWKDVYFFVNKDIIKSEIEFSNLSKCSNFIPAGTNVSNAMIVFLTQSDEAGARNFFGYDKILLIGFDYCWSDSKYYAFDNSGSGKDNYMRHMYVINGAGELCYTSGNLFFSYQWIQKYVSAYHLPVVQCSKRSLLIGCRKGDLAEQMNYTFDKEDSLKLRDMIKIKDNLLRNLRQIDNSLEELARKHTYNFLATT